MSAASAISVIIVNYHNYDELRVCLTALQHETWSYPSDVVVVDQCSDGRSVAKIREEFVTIRLFPKRDNDGFAAGVNYGAGQTQASYVLVLNPDTVVAPGLIAALARRLETEPDVAVVGPRILNAGGSVQPSARRFPDFTTGLGGRMSWLTRVAPGNWFSRRNLDWSRCSEPIDVDWVSGACMMIRRSAFDEVGGMDEGFFLYWEDADLCRRLRNAGYRTTYLPTVSAVHEGGRASRHAAARSLVAFHQSAFRYYWKHSGLAGRAFAPIVQMLLWGRLLIKLALITIRARLVD